ETSLLSTLVTGVTKGLSSEESSGDSALARALVILPAMILLKEKGKNLDDKERIKFVDLSLV
ncbi:hypothetical protein, partial [Klebsiella pneumoniae]|uniref:hypothetical protein n=1 Tax=Klebsiella pneumoniae TaxID=573 RepID=UPI001D0E295A